MVVIIKLGGYQMFADKFNMSVKDNVFWAKRNIVDYIYKSAKLEGINVTFPATQSIYDGGYISNLKVDDVIAINNMKRAWNFILDILDYPTDYSLICRVNQYIGGDDLIRNAGRIRKGPVSIGGTSWKPDMPIESQIKEEVLAIISDKDKSNTEQAMDLMLYCMRKQMFLDGNKRTAMLIANHIMISNGCGVISIPVELQEEFFILLVAFYETKDSSDIKDFLYKNCIDGYEF